jgi:hypothetical protein
MSIESIEQNLISRALDFTHFRWFFLPSGKNFFFPSNQELLRWKKFDTFDPFADTLELFNMWSVLLRIVNGCINVSIIWLVIIHLVLLPDGFDLDCDALALRIKKNGHFWLVLELDVEVNDEAPLFAANDQLRLLVHCFMEVYYLNQTDWHALLEHQLQVLIEDDEFEVFGAREVQVVVV